MSSETTTVEQELPGGWTAVLTWDATPVPGRGPTRIEIRPTDPASPPANGLSSTVLRDVSFSDAQREILMRGVLVVPELSFMDPDAASAIPSRITAERLAAELGEVANEGLSDRYLARLASAYLVLVTFGHSDPHGALATATRKSRATVKHHLWQAQRRGLFERSHGRKGGALTPKAKSLLSGS